MLRVQHNILLFDVAVGFASYRVTVDEMVLVCRPRLLFQYLPYIQQDALQLDAQDVEAVLEATCGGGGAPGAHSDIWGVMLLPGCVNVQAAVHHDTCPPTSAQNYKQRDLILARLCINIASVKTLISSCVDPVHHG